MIVSELPVPALLTRMSRPSKAEATRAQARSTSEALETSAAIASAFTRCDVAISPASRSARARSRATIATSTPSAASARATARPMPTLPPVMTARLPLSSRSMSCSHGHCTAPAEARGRSGHFQVLVLHDWTCLDQLVYVNERDERAPALVGDARLDVGGIHLEEEPGHLLERRRPPRIHARAQPGRPCQPAGSPAALPRTPAGAPRHSRNRSRTLGRSPSTASAWTTAPRCSPPAGSPE